MKLSERLRNTKWNDDKYAMMELRHWFELCDEVAQLEADNVRLREFHEHIRELQHKDLENGVHVQIADALKEGE
jgi:hypothetical protein